VVDPLSQLIAEQALHHTWLDADFKMQQAIQDMMKISLIWREVVGSIISGVSLKWQL